MIKKKTVFVLGAGASMPYGFPSGAELRNSICESALADTPMRTDLHLECGINPQHFKNFGEAFLRSSLPSIDTFLAKRPEYGEIGKLAIAYELCKRESPGRLFRTDNDDHWYMALWAAMERDTHDPASLGQNNVRFITFNYDRSLEFFLHEATRNTYGLSDEDALNAWSPLEILHVYGSLGDFHPAPSADARLYAEGADGRSLRLAASALRIIPEARQDDKAFFTAQEWFSWADRICFLGFGFDPLNMQRLGVGPTLSLLLKQNMRVPQIVASMFGKTAREIEAVVNRNFVTGTPLIEGNKNLMALRNTGFLD